MAYGCYSSDGNEGLSLVLYAYRQVGLWLCVAVLQMSVFMSKYLDMNVDTRLCSCMCMIYNCKQLVSMLVTRVNSGCLTVVPRSCLMVSTRCSA